MKTIMLWPAIAACTLLAACGGGSTSGGGGVGSTPTPTPGPTPTNTSLADLRFSEKFAADGATGTISTTGPTATKSTISVQYDASARSYTINASGRSQTFRSSDRSAADSTAEIDVYQRSSGSTTDSLVLTRAGSGSAFGLTYVGGGFWQRTGSSSGSLDAFTYGITTANAAVPRTGSGNYLVSLIGAIGYTDGANALGGSGALSVDFATGGIDVRGNTVEIAFTPDGTPVEIPGMFGGTGQLSASANAFNGSFQLGEYNGTWDGRFYGPAAEEVGAAFAVRSSFGTVAVGALFGGKSSTASSGPLLSQSTTTLALPSVFASVAEGGTQGPIAASTDITPADANHRTGGGTYGRVTPAPERSNARFTAYNIGANTLLSYNPGPGNPEFALSYMSFTARLPGLGDGLTRDQAWWEVYGLATEDSFVPRIGTAQYRGVVNGTANSVSIASGGGGEGQSYAMTGTAEILFNFGASSLTGSMSPVLRNLQTGTTVSLPSYTYNNGSINAGFGQFAAGIDGPAGTSGSLVGRFYGNAAQEAGAVFTMRTGNPQGGDIFAAGVIAVKKQ